MYGSIHKLAEFFQNMSTFFLDKLDSKAFQSNSQIMISGPELSLTIWCPMFYLHSNL